MAELWSGLSASDAYAHGTIQIYLLNMLNKAAMNLFPPERAERVGLVEWERGRRKVLAVRGSEEKVVGEEEDEVRLPADALPEAAALPRL